MSELFPGVILILATDALPIINPSFSRCTARNGMYAEYSVGFSTRRPIWSVMLSLVVVRTSMEVAFGAKLGMDERPGTPEMSISIHTVWYNK